MKKLYFVRHAESEGNVGQVRQGSHSSLTDQGNKQSELVAKRFSNISIDKIFSSSQKRAKNTAETINKILHKNIEYSDLLIERKRPSMLIGVPKDSSKALEADIKIKENFHVSDYRYADEENFQDLKKRVSDLFKYINDQKEENLLIVTHGVFLRMILAYVIMGEKLTSHEYWNIFISTEVDNTGISVFEQTKFGDEDPYWKLITWNDNTHLGEIK